MKPLGNICAFALTIFVAILVPWQALEVSNIKVPRMISSFCIFEKDKTLLFLFHVLKKHIYRKICKKSHYLELFLLKVQLQHYYIATMMTMWILWRRYIVPFLNELLIVVVTLSFLWSTISASSVTGIVRVGGITGLGYISDIVTIWPNTRKYFTWIIK